QNYRREIARLNRFYAQAEVAIPTSRYPRGDYVIAQGIAAQTNRSAECLERLLPSYVGSTAELYGSTAGYYQWIMDRELVDSAHLRNARDFFSYSLNELNQHVINSEKERKLVDSIRRLSPTREFTAAATRLHAVFVRMSEAHYGAAESLKSLVERMDNY